MSQATGGGRDYIALKKDGEYSISQLEKIKQLTNKLRGSLEIRITQSPLFITGLQIDSQYLQGTLLINLFALDPTGTPSGPFFTINRSTSSELFENFSNSLELVWKRSVELSPENTPPSKS